MKTDDKQQPGEPKASLLLKNATICLTVPVSTSVSVSLYDSTASLHPSHSVIISNQHSFEECDLVQDWNQQDSSKRSRKVSKRYCRWKSSLWFHSPIALFNIGESNYQISCLSTLCTLRVSMIREKRNSNTLAATTCKIKFSPHVSWFNYWEGGNQNLSARNLSLKGEGATTNIRTLI